MKKSDQHSALTAFSQGLFSGILILLLSALALSNPAYAANLSLSRTSLTLVYKTGNDLSGYGTLKVNGTSASPSWTSSDNTVAVVRKTSGSYARVWPKREGTCTITASVNGRKLRCRVTVVSKDAGMSVPAKKRIPPAPTFSTAGVKEYTFTDTIINGSKKDGDYVWKVCSGDEPKIIHLRGHIYLNWEGNDKIMKIGSNTMIDAVGATVTTSMGVIMTNLQGGMADGGNYDAAENIQVIGGSWGYEGGSLNTSSSMFQFVHCSNLLFRNLTIRANNKAQAIEIVACKNVWIEKCTISGSGANSSLKQCPQVQIDVANRKTVSDLRNYQNGHACRNVYISGNRISGERGLAISFDKAESADYHRNVVIQNNQLTGSTAEGLMVANTVGLDIEGNQVMTRSTELTGGNNYRSIALHVALESWAPPADLSTAWTLVRGNTAYGGRSAITVYPNVGKFGSVAVIGNRAFYKGQKALAIHVGKSVRRKVSDNTIEKWGY